MTNFQAQLTTASDAGSPTQPIQDEIDRVTGEITSIDIDIGALNTTMDGLQQAWDAAEEDRMELEDNAERAAENADWEMAKQYFEEQEARFNALEREVEEWKELRDMEMDLVLWEEYQEGYLHAQEQLDEQREYYEQEMEWFNEMDEAKQRRADDDAIQAAAAAAEAAYGARQAEITTAEAARD